MMAPCVSALTAMLAIRIGGSMLIAGDGVGGHAGQQRPMAGGDHADAGREAGHQLPQPASLLVLHRRLAYAAGMVASRVSTRQVR